MKMRIYSNFTNNTVPKGLFTKCNLIHLPSRCPSGRAYGTWVGPDIHREEKKAATRNPVEALRYE